MTWWMWVLLVLLIIGAVENNKEKKQKEEELLEFQRRRKEAEDYIMSSGDPEAIKMLMLARANPANYRQILTGGMNKGSETLKTALGVMAGVAAGNLIANAVSAAAISNALESMNSNLASIDTSAIDDLDTEIDFDF